MLHILHHLAEELLVLVAGEAQDEIIGVQGDGIAASAHLGGIRVGGYHVLLEHVAVVLIWEERFTWIKGD